MKLLVDEDASSNELFEASAVAKAPDLSTISDAANSCLEGAKIGGVLSTPAVRNFAKQLGVGIEDVPGTGEGGRVMKEDVLNFAARAGLQQESSPPTEQYHQGDKKSHEVLSTYQWEYEDKTIPLRYVIACFISVLNFQLSDAKLFLGGTNVLWPSL